MEGYFGDLEEKNRSRHNPKTTPSESMWCSGESRNYVKSKGYFGNNVKKWSSVYIIHSRIHVNPRNSGAKSGRRRERNGANRRKSGGEGFPATGAAPFLPGRRAPPLSLEAKEGRRERGRRERRRWMRWRDLCLIGIVADWRVVDDLGFCVFGFFPGNEVLGGVVEEGGNLRNLEPWSGFFVFVCIFGGFLLLNLGIWMFFEEVWLGSFLESWPNWERRYGMDVYCFDFCFSFFILDLNWQVIWELFGFYLEFFNVLISKEQL